ncbi:hypothetical protein SNEBB_007885 [Seison nebaliae]|nr:hypothetical protein SNEBB_007885 [Seison nebaliae]
MFHLVSPCIILFLQILVGINTKTLASQDIQFRPIDYTIVIVGLGLLVGLTLSGGIYYHLKSVRSRKFMKNLLVTEANEEQMDRNQPTTSDNFEETKFIQNSQPDNETNDEMKFIQNSQPNDEMNEETKLITNQPTNDEDVKETIEIKIESDNDKNEDSGQDTYV